MKPFFQRLCTKRTLRWLGALALLAFLALNVVAYLHARAMTHFTAAGTRTKSAEQLSLGEKVWVLLTGVRVPKPMNQRTPADLGLPFETHRFRSTAGVTLEAWWISRPQSKGLVLLFHGYSASKDSLLPAARALHTLGYESVLVDLRGSGGSSGVETSIGYHEAEDVAATVAYAQKTRPGQPVVLYGASMGAAAILRSIHAKGVQPAAIIIECPFDRLLTTAKMRFAAMKLPAFPSAHLLVFWGGVQHGFNGFRHNPAEYARSVRCQVLLLHGEKDARVTLAQMENFRQNFNRLATVTVFSGLSHESYLAARPAEWNATVSQFLQTHLSPALPRRE